MADATPNYHISLWDDPPAYVCLLCGGMPPATMTLEAVCAHVGTVHSAVPVPTPLAADPSMPMLLVTKETPDGPSADVLHHDG